MRDIIRRIDRTSEAPQQRTSEKSHLILEQKPFVEKTVPEGTKSPLQLAREIIGAAEGASGAGRVELARRALEITKDCADAYVILAEETARSLDAAKQLYEQGVRAGERALGENVIRNGPDSFRSASESGSYLRARAGLAQCLWSSGSRQEAIGHCADMLRLDPSDGQGVRYLLVNWLLHEELHDDLENLLSAFEGDKATSWLYTRALWAFGREGACERAEEYLQEALKRNPYVPSYLLGLKKMPGILPEHVEAGDEREAISYIAEALNTWLKTEGALEWLIMSLPKALRRPRPESS
jgi:tetratricopeptide (TPR) repeat protein